MVMRAPVKTILTGATVPRGGLLGYRLVQYVCWPLLVLRLFWRAARSPRYFQHWPQRLGYRFGLPASTMGGIWIHAVSVGEVNAVLPLVQCLLTANAARPIILTTMTPTGAARVAQCDPRIHHCYLPYDYPGAVRRFLDAAQPQLAVIMETEIWPNFIHACWRRQIPILYSNVRLSARAHHRYRRFRSVLSPTLKKITRFAVQSQVEAERLRDLGAPPAVVQVTGNMKFDLTVPDDLPRRTAALRAELGAHRRFWVAGSTHHGEEAPVLAAYQRARVRYADLLLILVPRHPERFGAVARLCRTHGYKTQLRSHHQPVAADTEVYLADTMGELATLLGLAEVAFIGGSLVAQGGHNVLEACVVGTPVIFGPHMGNFRAIAEQVLIRAAGVQVFSSAELAETVIKFLDDPVLCAHYAANGRRFVAENKGAVERNLAIIAELSLNDRRMTGESLSDE